MTSFLYSVLDAGLKQAFKGQDYPQKLAVAVSGGSDSMALCLLVNEWCRKNSVFPIAITVDHGLRAEASEEADQVNIWLSNLNISHTVLKWKGPYPKTGIQKAARSARYELIVDECNRQGVGAILLGHQLEDQLETLLMRFSKGSGLQGLSAMALTTHREGKLLIRPFLDVPRKVLRDYLIDQQQIWTDDPSNENPAYTRTKLGSVLQSITGLPGSRLESVALSSKRLRRADAALEYITNNLLSAHTSISPYGFVTAPGGFNDLMPPEVSIRFLERIFTFVRGTGEKPELSKIEKLLADIQLKEQLPPRTLAGCQIGRFKGNWIICREPGRTGLPVCTIKPSGSILWDNRFVVVDHENTQDEELDVRVIGDLGWQMLKESGVALNRILAPKIVLKNLPAVWKKGQMVAVPLFSYESERMGIVQERFEMVFSPKCGLIM